MTAVLLGREHSTDPQMPRRRVRQDPLAPVLLPTRKMSPLLARSTGSVLAQEHSADVNSTSALGSRWMCRDQTTPYVELSLNCRR